MNFDYAGDPIGVIVVRANLHQARLAFKPTRTKSQEECNGTANARLKHNVYIIHIFNFSDIQLALADPAAQRTFTRAQ